MTIDGSEAWIDLIFNAILSDVVASGYLSQVNVAEADIKPHQGLVINLWLQEMYGVGAISGLNSTSAVLVFVLRIYCSMTLSPGDVIDPTMVKAASNLFRRWHDDFDFGGIIRNVDVLGITNQQLRYSAGYFMAEDGQQFRVVDITIPCIVDDVWPQIN